MFPSKLIPLFALGCAPISAVTDDVGTEPDVTTDPGLTDDQVDDSYEPADYESMEINEVRSKIWDHVDKLHGLQIIEVGEVILDLPDEALCAYAWTPCTGFEDMVDDALRDVAPRLDSLAHNAQVATESNAATSIDTCDADIVDANLDDLTDLQIIEVGDLLVAEPERNCPYNQPCEEDIIAAEELTCDRAASLDRLVDSSIEL